MVRPADRIGHGCRPHQTPFRRRPPHCPSSRRTGPGGPFVHLGAIGTRGARRLRDGSRLMAGVSVIIVNWNARDVLRDCLRSLERHPPPDPWEVIVVDNGSRDGSVEMLRDEMPWVRLIANQDNRGLPAANNQGIAASS